MANDCIPYKKPGADISGKCTAAVGGKRLCKVSGNRTSGPGLAATGEGSVYQVAQCVAGDRPVGVAAWDAALGEIVNLIAGGIVPIIAGAAITAGARLQADANGAVIPLASGYELGVAMSGAGSGQDCEVMLALQ